MLNINLTLRGLVAGLGCMVLALPVLAAEPAWVQRSNDNARLLLDVVAKYSPERALSLIHISEPTRPY